MPVEISNSENFYAHFPGKTLNWIYMYLFVYNQAGNKDLSKVLTRVVGESLW